MFEMKKIACAILAAVCVDASYADAVLTPHLLEQAQYWQQRGRDDIAADTWRKVLTNDPANPDALAGLSVYEAQAGHAQAARALLDKLRSADPANPKIAATEAAIKQGKTASKSQLNEARRLANDGQADEAVEKYKLMGDPAQLKGDAALEYYQVLSGTISGWDEARSGMERLVKDNPANRRYLLALAQHYTYRQSTRREGIRILISLSQSVDYGPQADASWRQALTWLGSERGDSALFQQYLSNHPGDEAIKQRLADLNKSAVAEKRSRAYSARIVVNPAAKKYARAYQLLKDGDIAAAETLFVSLLNANPADPSATGGLGIVRMYQKNFAAASELLKRAAASQRNSTWIPAYNNARYWAAVQGATVARQQDNQQLAIAGLRDAILIDEKEPTAHIMLADMLAESGDYLAAEANYRTVLREHKDNEQAIFGLINVLTALNRNEEVPALTARLSAEQRLGSNSAIVTVQVNNLRLVAKAAEASGDLDKAQLAYEDALLISPDSPWIRLDLARLYLRRSMPGQARSLLDGLLESEPNNADVLYVSAMLSADQRMWWEGLSTLENVPAKQRSKELISLQNALWMHVQMDRATAFYKQGNAQQANEIMANAELVAGKNTDLMAVVADTYLANDNMPHGLALLRKMLLSTQKPSVNLRLQYANALFQSGQTAELDAVLRQLSAIRTMTTQEQAGLASLRREVVLRQADAAREAGNLAGAYDIIQPLWAQNPQDVPLTLAVARMYSSAGDVAQANALYATVLKTEPDNREALQASAYSLIAARDFSGAEKQINTLMVLEPDNPRTVALAGRLARAQGNNGKALELFHQAQALERSQMVTGQGVTGLRLVDRQADDAVSGTPATPSVPAMPAMPTARQWEQVPVNPFSGKPMATQPQLNEVPSIPFSGKPAARQLSVLPALNVAPVIAMSAVTATAVPVAVSGVPGVPAQIAGDSALQREIMDLQSQNNSQFTAELAVRNRSGQSGFSQLSDIELPMQLLYNTKNDGQLGLKLTPVSLNAGTINLNDPTVAGLFGREVAMNERAIYNKLPFTAIALTDGLVTPSLLNERGTGLALDLSYEIRNLKIDLGVSPVGFAVTNVIGGVHWNDQIGGLDVGVDVSRRSVTDSYLSYAGTTDSLYGLKWGGVTKNGLKIDVSHENDGLGFYGNIGLADLMGENVARNSEFELGAGVYSRVYTTQDTVATVGLSFTSMFYDKNLSNFTYGQGGYFSPQRYVALGVPADITGRSGRLSYQLGGSIGVQSFTQSSSAYYPLGTSDQATLLAFAASNPSLTIATTYPGQSHSGIAYKLSGGVEYRLNASFVLGGRLSIDNSGDFTESSGLLYLRYYFVPQIQPVIFPPSPVKPYFQG